MEISFEPPDVLVPDDWEFILNQNDTQELSESQQLEVKKIKEGIFDVTYVKNSHVEDQEYFDYQLTSFNETGVTIQMNFSDPILISQGFEPDQLQIKLRKAFFLQPSTEQSQSGSGRMLLKKDTAYYLTLISDLPKQLESQSDLDSLEETA